MESFGTNILSVLTRTLRLTSIWNQLHFFLWRHSTNINSHQVQKTATKAKCRGKLQHVYEDRCWLPNTSPDTITMTFKWFWMLTRMKPSEIMCHISWWQQIMPQFYSEWQSLETSILGDIVDYFAVNTILKIWIL